MDGIFKIQRNKGRKCGVGNETYGDTYKLVTSKLQVWLRTFHTASFRKENITSYVIYITTGK